MHQHTWAQPSRHQRHSFPDLREASAHIAVALGDAGSWAERTDEYASTGLAAARKLRSFGFKVVILEGRGRPGGRVYTKQLQARILQPTLQQLVSLDS